jgi:hypothetical protein
MLRLTLWLAVWAAAMVAVLSISESPGNWGHGICGPWGCGPPLQALLACHMAWLVVILPPVMWLRRSDHIPARLRSQFGVSLCGATLLSLIVLVVYERTTWYPAVDEWQRGFFWRRIGFVIITSVDLPMGQSLLAGMLLVLGSQRHRARAPESELRESRAKLVQAPLTTVRE